MPYKNLAESLYSSSLTTEMKRDTLAALERGDIMLGEEALEKGLVPKTVTAGSFDPPTFGHDFLIHMTKAMDDDAGVIVVASTSKALDYQLHSPIVRAGLIRSYGHSMRIILGWAEEPEKHRDILRQLHQAPERIVKGKRTDEDTEHTYSLVQKYGIPQSRFVEVESPAYLRHISSGNLKGELLALANIDVVRCTIDALMRRHPEQNKIFLDRLAAGSSEKMFHSPTAA